MSLEPIYRDFAVRMAQEAGQIMKENFAHQMTREWKADHSPVTATDLAINQIVLDEVIKNFPDHVLLAEEQSNYRSGTEYVWVCDPVDGTIPFSHHVPLSAFSLALVKNGQPLLGVVYDPHLDRLLVAELGQGATMNGQPIRVSTASSLYETVINLDGPFTPNFRVETLLRSMKQERAKVTKFCSQVYGGLLVAIGEFSAAFCMGNKPWDIAALKVIVEEAGGRVSSLAGNEQRYDQDIQGALVSNGQVHEHLLQLVEHVHKKEPSQAESS